VYESGVVWECHVRRGRRADSTTRRAHLENGPVHDHREHEKVGGLVGSELA
jgi:hypothetical protein